MKNSIKTCITLSLLSIFINSAFAKQTNIIEFFASNNTNEISIEMAYERLISKEQHKLQNNIINLMQKNHMEQGRLIDILGAYQMTSSQTITSDNTEIFIVSPYQALSQQKIIDLGKYLANRLNQESVAVFVSDNTATISHIKIKFLSRKPSINETITILKQKLPPLYSQAYSLHLDNEHDGFNNAKVSAIEWLGSKLNMDEIKKVFPQDKLTYNNGLAYLIYKNGQIEQL